MVPYLYSNKLQLLILIFCVPHTVTSRSTVRPNELVSYSIPENRPLKKALGFHEDTYLNFTELVVKYNYTPETHTVITKDGYILTVFRLVNSKCKGEVKPYPVLLMHGLLDTADIWILAGPKISLGFLLAKNCYDVWAANHRGNYYSRHHVRLNPDKDREFWNYSFDEHGNFDVPAVVDYILQKTGKPQVHYIGHSQGTSDFLIMNSLKPEYNDKVRLSILLAPIAWMKNIISPGLVLASHNAGAIQAFLESAGLLELFAKDMLTHNILEFTCQKAPKLCEIALHFGTGYKPGTITPETISIAFGHLLSGTSVKTLAHFGQLITSGRFQRYDEGRKGNMKRYGMPKSPEYDVSKITTPVVLMTAQSDWVSNLKDTDTLASKLPNLVENHVIPAAYWSHHNHVWGITTPELENSKIVEYLERFDR